MTAVDLNALKQIEGLATADTTTYITLSAGCVEDMSANPVLALADGFALKASAFTADTTDPKMVNFAFDMNQGSLKFHFDETASLSFFLNSPPANFEIVSEI